MNVDVNEGENLIPRQFIFLSFYGQDICIVWYADTLIVLQYPLCDSLESGKRLKAPGIVRDIQCLQNKSYILCSPTGIYKLSQDYSFARISINGTCLGTEYYQVFAPRKNILYYENKHNKDCKPLFSISSDVKNPQDLRTFHLYVDQTELNFRKALLEDNFNCDACLITNGKSLLIFLKESVKVVYSSHLIIDDIVAIPKNDLIFGIVLLTNINIVIFVYPENDKLRFDKVRLNSTIQVFCTGICRHAENTVWILYSDLNCTFHLLKELYSDYYRVLSVVNKSFLCLKTCKAEKLLGLTLKETSSICFDLVPIEAVDSIDDNTTSSDLFELNQDMMQGIDTLFDEICDKVEKLGEVNMKLSKEQDLTRRINMYTIKRRVQFIPEIRVHSLSDRKIIVVDFHKNLPQNSQIVVTLQEGNAQVTSIKRVTNSETTVELPVLCDKITAMPNLKIHSIIVNSEPGPWCFINDFVKDPVRRKDSEPFLNKEKLSFLKTKLSALRILIKDGKIDMQSLYDIKSSVRRELTNITMHLENVPLNS